MATASGLRGLQHDIMLQSIYPSKGESLRPLFLEQSLCQARSEVLMALLFGGRVVTSAGAFFDSDIAVRVFGELFAHKGFGRMRANRSWQPLVLNTDLPDPLTPLQFVLERWRKPEARFGFFREFGGGNGQAPHAEHPVRARVVAFLESGSDKAGDLDAAMAGLWEPFYLEAGHGPKTLTPHPAILREGSGFWLRDILAYLGEDGNFQCRGDVAVPGALDLFSPADFIAKRTAELADATLAGELADRNAAFIAALGGRRMMNSFHIEGPDIYGHDYELICHWIETEWHAVRHVMYDTATLRLSSSRLRKELLDRDPNQRIGHFHPMTVHEDETVQPDAVGFADFDWGVLFGVIDSSTWHNLLEEVRTGENGDGATRRLVEFVARKLTDFSFDEENGRVRVVARCLAQGLSYGGLASMFQSPLFGLTGLMASPVVRNAGTIAKVAAPALRVAHEKHLGHQLRKAIVPRLVMGLMPERVG